MEVVLSLLFGTNVHLSVMFVEEETIFKIFSFSFAGKFMGHIIYNNNLVN